MSTPKRLIESSFAQHAAPDFFTKFLSWRGGRVGHARLLPREGTNKQLNMHHIFIPLAGSFEASMVMVSGHITHARRTVGQASIVPAGQQYSAFWKDELEDIAIHLDPDFVAHQASELVQTERIDLIRYCEVSDPLVHQIGRSLAAEVDAGAPPRSVYAQSLGNTPVAHLLRHYSPAGGRMQHY